MKIFAIFYAIFFVFIVGGCWFQVFNAMDEQRQIDEDAAIRRCIHHGDFDENNPRCEALNYTVKGL